MITPFDEPITILRYGAEVVAADGLSSRPVPTPIPTMATVERGVKRLIREARVEYLRGIHVLAFVEIRDGDEGTRLPADRLVWQGRTYEVVTSDYAGAFATEPAKWEVFASEIKAWGLP